MVSIEIVELLKIGFLRGVNLIDLFSANIRIYGTTSI